MPLSKRYSKRGSYYTGAKRPAKKTERRIVIPSPPTRPARFQVRSLIRQELIHKDPWWMVVHRRGISRPRVGEDPLEARAVPHDLVRGTLPERIVYRSLVDEFRLVPDFDFNFQTSLQGGRIDTGGIVADFLFPIMKMVIQVQGPTHFEYLREKKDEEQMMALEEMGYHVLYIEEPEIYDEYRFDNWMRRTLGWIHSGNQMSPPEFDAQESNSGFTLDKLKTELMEISNYVQTGVY